MNFSLEVGKEVQAQGEDLSSLWQEALKEQEEKEREEKREVLMMDIQEKLKKFLDLPCGEGKEGKEGSLVLSRYVVRYRGGSDRFGLYHWL